MNFELDIISSSHWSSRVGSGSSPCWLPLITSQFLGFSSKIAYFRLRYPFFDNFAINGIISTKVSHFRMVSMWCLDFKSCDVSWVADDCDCFADVSFSLISLDGFDACATIWFRLIVIPESKVFMIVVTRKSFLATVNGIIKSFFVWVNFLKFSFLISFLRNSYSEKLRTFSKTAPSVPFSGRKSCYPNSSRA